LLATLRAAGGTAGLLAVLTALLAAIIRLGAPQPAAAPAAARGVYKISAAGTALQHMIKAVRSGNLRALPPEVQTAVAPLGHEPAAGAQWKIDRMSVGAAHLTVDGHLVRVTSSGAPVAVIPVRVDALKRPARGAVVKSVVVGTPSPIPTIAAGDGIVYVHLDSIPAVPAEAGAARGDIEWHAFAPGGRPRVLVTPGPTQAQGFTGLSASPDGDAVTYAVAGRGSDGGIFRLTIGALHPTKVLAPDSGLLQYGALSLLGRLSSGPTPHVQTPHLAVGSVFPLSDGRLSFAVVVSATVSVAITSSHGLQTVAHLGASVRDYAISPDGHAIAWVQQDGRYAGRLEVADLGARPQTIGLGSYPVWAPDSRSILFLQGTARGNSHPALALWSARNGSIRQLVKPDPVGDQFISAFAWAPGGRFFTYVVSSPGAHGTSTVWLGDAHTGYTWKAFTRRWIGAVAWVHGPTVATPAATPTPGPIAITVQASGTQQILGPGGTATVPYGRGYVYVVLHFPAPVDGRSVDVRAQPATRRLEVKKAAPGNTYAFRVRRDVPGAVDVTLERALDRNG
jgi:hypothetical protein